MSPNRVSRVQLVLVMLLLLGLQFYLRPRLWDARISPDFLLIALMLFAMRSSPGVAAVAGFAVGLLPTRSPQRDSGPVRSRTHWWGISGPGVVRCSSRTTSWSTRRLWPWVCGCAI